MVCAVIVSVRVLCCVILSSYWVSTYRYNNKTYRIDDIDFRQNPKSSFESSKGAKTYLEYYREVSCSTVCFHLVVYRTAEAVDRNYYTASKSVQI